VNDAGRVRAAVGDALRLSEDGARPSPELTQKYLPVLFRVFEALSKRGWRRAYRASRTDPKGGMDAQRTL